LLAAGVNPELGLESGLNAELDFGVPRERSVAGAIRTRVGIVSGSVIANPPRLTVRN
jgi:hypothetical protein